MERFKEPTPGELEALRAVARLGTIREAAAELCVSPHTVDSRLDSLRGKTGCRYLPQLFWWAAASGLLLSPVEGAPTPAKSLPPAAR